MVAMSRRVSAGLLILSIPTWLLAQAPALNINKGLWEFTSTSSLGGPLPSLDTSKMTPQQKAAMEATLKSTLGPHTNVVKSCVTPEKFNRLSFMDFLGEVEKENTKCTQSIETNTRSTLDTTFTCTGQHAASGQRHIEAPSPTSIKGTFKRTMTNQGRTITADAVITGKWLGAECGDVK